MNARGTATLAIVALAAAYAGCQPPVGDAPPAAPAPPADRIAVPAPARPWSAAGLEDQPRMAVLRATTPPELGFTPGTTTWRVAAPPLPPAFRREQARYPTAGRMVTELAAALGLADALGSDTWEITTRVHRPTEDTATGMILQWGFQDDAVAGADLRLDMARAPGGWYVRAAWERFHCLRGVTADGLCI